MDISWAKIQEVFHQISWNLKALNMGLELCDHFEIWRVFQQQCCWNTCQISDWCDNLAPDLMASSLHKIWQWDVILLSIEDLGWLSRFPPFRYFPNFSTSSKCMLGIKYNVHIWRVSPQLSCGNTCKIWIRFKECNRYFCKIKIFAYGEIDEQSFSNPHPWGRWCYFPDTAYIPRRRLYAIL